MKRGTVKNILLVAMAVVAALWIYRKLSSLPSLSAAFSSQPVVIDKTPILIKEIKSLEQLITISSFDEVVVDSVVYSRNAGLVNVFNNALHIPLFPALQKRLVLIAKGKVLAGINLKELSAGSLLIRNDTVHLQLPKAIIIDAILNPSDFEVFEETGTWSDEAVRAVKLKARQKIVNRALQQNILVKAETKSRAVMESFLKNAGYRTIVIN